MMAEAPCQLDRLYVALAALAVELDELGVEVGGAELTDDEAGVLSGVVAHLGLGIEQVQGALDRALDRDHSQRARDRAIDRALLAAQREARRRHGYHRVFAH